MDLFRRLRGASTTPASTAAMDEEPSAAVAVVVVGPAPAAAAAADGLVRALSLKPIKTGGSDSPHSQQQQQQQQQHPQQQQQQQGQWALAAAWGSVTPPPGPEEAAAAAAAAASAAPATRPPLQAAAAATAAAPSRPSPHVQVDFLEPQSQHRPSFDNGANANAANAANANAPAPPASSSSSPSRAPPPPGSTDVRARDLVLRGEGLLSVYPLLPHPLRRDKWRLRHFELVQALHKGYASTVYRAKCLKSGHLVALKVYFLAGLTPLTVYQTFREVALHSTIVCDGCAALWAAWREGDAVVLAQEYVGGGDLAHALRGPWGGRVSERHAVSCVIEPLLSTLQYLHARGIAHRDIKPENLLLSEAGGALKLADFGLSIDLGSESAVTRAGTLHYMAPEVLNCPLKRSPSDGKLNAGSIGYGHGVDVWSVGVLAYELVAGITPFRSDDGSKERTVHAIQRGLFGGGRGAGAGGGGAFAWPPRFSEELKSFVTAALQPDPARRPSAHELSQHPWVAQYRRPASQASMAVGLGGGVGAAHKPGAGGGAAAAVGGAAAAAAAASPRRAPRATVDEVGRGVPHLAISPAARRLA